MHLVATVHTIALPCTAAGTILYDQKYWQSKYLVILPLSRKDKCWQNLNLVKVISYDIIMKTHTGLIQHTIFYGVT